MTTKTKYNLCLTCGKNCRKTETKCSYCKRFISCLVCGVETTRPLCSPACRDRWTKFKEILPSLGHDRTCDNSDMLYEGDILSVWSEGGAVFFSFNTRGVTLVFEDMDELNVLMDDLYCFICSQLHWDTEP